MSTWYIPGEALIWRKKQEKGYPILIRVKFRKYTSEKYLSVELPNGQDRLLEETQVRRPVYATGVLQKHLTEYQEFQ